MKNILLLIAIQIILLIKPDLTSVIFAQNSESVFFESTNRFFSKYVKNGLVDYSSIQSNSTDLKTLVEQIAEFDNLNNNDEGKSAFLINAYNILTIKGILEKYPVSSPMKINGFFDAKIYIVGGKKMSLNTLEKKELFGHFPDPRLHFVLVCAAKSCPKLANFAYKPELLDQQLTDQTSIAINDPEFIQYNGGKVLFSEIFSWYASDFKKASGSALKFVNEYKNPPFDSGSKTGFYTYDWSLNDTK